MYSPDINTRQLIQSVATCLIGDMDEYNARGIPFGDNPNDVIVHIGYLDEGKEIWLRTSNDRAYIMRLYPYLGAVHGENSIGRQDTEESYKRYERLTEELRAVLKVAERMGQDQDDAMQTWHDDHLDDEDRAHWARWTSGGHATKTEWHIARG